MVTDLKSENKMANLDFDKAMEIFIDKFLELHPKITWPDWFKRCTSYGGKKDDKNFWRFAFTALPNDLLNKNEYWEIGKDGSRHLVVVDPDTGEKRYIISNTTDEVITLFEVEINPDTAEITVLKDEDLNKINGEGLLVLN
ncbi:MAG: hypothetical protein PVH87_05340 [Desulfobacteraceae bacterium]|jgi:hypothetical protein